MLRFLYFVTLIIFVVAVEEYSLIGSCDDSSVPYRLEVNPQSRAELFCTLPYCFRTDVPVTKCTGYKSVKCQPNQWIGGIMEVRKGNKTLWSTKCCTYVGLEEAHMIHQLTIGPGQKFEGGAYVANDGIEGFDLIKDVRRVVDDANRVSYIVSIVRMPCQFEQIWDDGRLASVRKENFPSELYENSDVVEKNQIIDDRKQFNKERTTKMVKIMTDEVEKKTVSITKRRGKNPETPIIKYMVPKKLQYKVPSEKKTEEKVIKKKFKRPAHLSIFTLKKPM